MSNLEGVKCDSMIQPGYVDLCQGQSVTGDPGILKGLYMVELIVPSCYFTEDGRNFLSNLRKGFAVAADESSKETTKKKGLGWKTDPAEYGRIDSFNYYLATLKKKLLEDEDFKVVFGPDHDIGYEIGTSWIQTAREKGGGWFEEDLINGITVFLGKLEKNLIDSAIAVFILDAGESLPEWVIDQQIILLRQKE